jgi:hypothetical protein
MYQARPVPPRTDRTGPVPTDLTNPGRDYPSRGRNGSTSTVSCDLVPRLLARLVVDYFALRGSSSTTSPTSCDRVPRLIAQLLIDYFASRGSSSTISPTSCERVPRLVAPLIVDYFASRGSSSTTSPCTARHRLLLLRHTYGCLGTSRGSSRGSSSTTSPTPHVGVPQHVARLVVDYFALRRVVVDYLTYVVRPGASARRVARRRLLCLCRVSGCLGTSHGSSSTTSPRAAHR